MGFIMATQSTWRDTLLTVAVVAAMLALLAERYFDAQERGRRKNFAREMAGECLKSENRNHYLCYTALQSCRDDLENCGKVIEKLDSLMYRAAAD